MKFFPKTHYECAMKHLNDYVPGVFSKKMCALGNDPTFEQFSTHAFDSPLPSDPYGLKMINNYINIYFHLYQMKCHGEKIYYITPELSTRLAQTNLNTDTCFLKSPFREIFIQIDPGLFYINDTDSTKVPVHGFYAYFLEQNNIKYLRIMACSLLEPTPELPFNDSAFYFHFELKPGKIQDQVYTCVNSIRKKEPEELALYDFVKNIDYFGDFAQFVLNCLLYITSKGASLELYIPETKKKIERSKSSKKKKKLERRLDKETTHNIIIVGENIMSNNQDLNNIKKSGGIGAWKLQYKIQVSAHWRTQWYGSKKDDTRYSETIWIDSYSKGPEFSETIKSRYIVK